MIDVNVNNYVYVRLTEFGKKELRKQHEELCNYLGKHADYVEPVEDVGGWSKWQMHDLMNRFGSMMTAGLEIPFETTIRINEYAKVERDDDLEAL